MAALFARALLFGQLVSQLHVARCETPASQPLRIQLSMPGPATSIPFHLGPNIAPDGSNVSVDSRSLFLNGRRWIPTSGEIHHARIPAAQWKEELLKMKAGGLDSIGAYAFWNHYEEREGEWNFTGRRNLRQFVQIAHEVGLKVLMRIGPWCHGEVRNGGHPDWLLKRAKDGGFPLRSNNSRYMEFVEKLYRQLAKQLDGLWWAQGGPVYAVQLDNETPDWRFVLALKTLAEKVGMRPPTFTKTGWPTPSSGYPKDYPMLPFFGGYQDQFWTKDMHDDVSVNAYFFVSAPSSSNGWTVPEGYPWLDVEQGGGMASAYNHRVHMASEDMPAAHLATLASGANGMGYYMYHGGNNPHSVFGDAPEAGLQESSFMPAGPQNPMPSISYDFFAPIGEFGQLRRHFHEMRRLHMFLREFDSTLAATTFATPAVQPKNLSDTATLRWGMRSDGESGVLFVNNYQRLTTLAPKEGVRFDIALHDGRRITIPHPNSSSLRVPSGMWMHWPVNFRVGAVTIRWATGQVLGSVASSPSERTLVLATSSIKDEAIPFELALASAGLASARCGANSSGRISRDDAAGLLLVTGLTPGTDAAVTVTSLNGQTLHVVLLPSSRADSLWKLQLAGREYFGLGDVETTAFLADGATLHICAPTPLVRLALLPTPPGLSLAGRRLTGHADGVFFAYDVPVQLATVPEVRVTKVREEGRPRDVPLAKTGKAREPTAEEWKQAGVWTLQLDASAFAKTRSQLRLAIRYRGDAARAYAGDALLTDNWFAGYVGDGQMEIGLSYLAGEHAILLSDRVNITLHILPLRRDTLETKVYLRKELWPEFGEDSSVCKLDAVDVLQLGASTLTVSEGDEPPEILVI